MELVRNAEFVRKVTGSTFRASVPVLTSSDSARLSAPF